MLRDIDWIQSGIITGIIIACIIVFCFIDSCYEGTIYNDGIHDRDGGKWVYKQITHYDCSTKYVYQCDKCGEIIRLDYKAPTED